jgi:hypothetical protein
MAGMEKPTTDETGNEGSEVEAALASQDVNDLLRMSLSDAGAGGDGNVSAGTDLGTVDKFWLTSDAAHATAMFRWMLLPIK